VLTARLIGVELHFLDRLERLVKVFVVSGHLPNTAYSDDEYMESLGMLEDLTEGRSPETIFEPRKYNIETENVATRQGSEKPPRPTHQQTLAHTVA
jgi:hypothetical protein